MYDVGILEKSKGVYQVSPEIHKVYKEFSGRQGTSEESDIRAENQKVPASRGLRNVLRKQPRMDRANPHHPEPEARDGDGAGREGSGRRLRRPGNP